MVNAAIYKAITKNLEHLIGKCGECDMVRECEEKRAFGDNDYEPRYCISIIEAAVMNALNFKIPFNKSKSGH